MSPDSAAGLYVHVPFCSAICPYCDFAVVRGDRRARADYVEHLVREIAGGAAGVPPCETVYFGGGTPSMLPPDELSLVLERLRAAGWLAPEPAIHLEANPEDVDVASVRAWRRLGIAFLSLGVQSLDDGELRFLGRRHTADIAARAVSMAREAGFPTVSMDLIYGLPGQSEDAWRRRLDAAVGLRPDHVSCYQLTVHEGTPFGRRLARGTLTEATADVQGALFLTTHRRLAEHGYDGYEVSNFARAGQHRSRHNQKYWEHVPYRGVGPSAHSFDGRSRWWNERSLRDWSRRIDQGEAPVAGLERLDDAQLVLECVMLGLRTKRGVDLAVLEERYGVKLLDWNRALVERLVDERLVEIATSRLTPTLDGMAVADGLASAFTLTEARG